MRRSLSLVRRRVAETRQTFANYPQVYLNLALSAAKVGPKTITFKMRDGITMECPNVAGARVPVYEIFSEDAYRMAEMTADLPEGFTAMDIGGQIGCFTVSLCQKRPDAVVHTFEASPVSAEIATRNVARNGYSDRATVHPTAISDKTGTLVFHDNGSGSGLNGVHGFIGDPNAIGDAEVIGEVPCVTFTDAVALAGGDVALVKIDTEGAEYEIILGSKPADWATVQRVVIEYHPAPGRSWDELEAFFADAGLVPTRHEPVDVGLGTVFLSRR